MRNLKSMYYEKNSDEIDHYKNFGLKKLKFLSKKQTYFPSKFRNLLPKIFEATKILYFWKWAKDEDKRWIFGQKSPKNEDLQSFVATLELFQWIFPWTFSINFSMDFYNGSSQSVHSSMTSMNFFNGLSNGLLQWILSICKFFHGLSNRLFQWTFKWIFSICTFFHDTAMNFSIGLFK